MAKVRLKSKQWAGFSSHLGVTKFEKGVSVDHVTHREGQLLGSITAVEYIDDEGKVIGNAGMAQVQVDSKGMSAPVEKKKIMASDKYEHREEINADPVKFEAKNIKVSEEDEATKDLEKQVSEIESEETKETETQKVSYTKERLEEIADTDGITGLRLIGESLEVRSNSIENLIDKILKAQG